MGPLSPLAWMTRTSRHLSRRGDHPRLSTSSKTQPARSSKTLSLASSLRQKFLASKASRSRTLSLWTRPFAKTKHDSCWTMEQTRWLLWHLTYDSSAMRRAQARLIRLKIKSRTAPTSKTRIWTKRHQLILIWSWKDKNKKISTKMKLSWQCPTKADRRCRHPILCSRR